MRAAAAGAAVWCRARGGIPGLQGVTGHDPGETRKMLEAAAAAEPGPVFRYEYCFTIGKAGIMKLHESPGKIIRQSGVSVLRGRGWRSCSLASALLGSIRP